MGRNHRFLYPPFLYCLPYPYGPGQSLFLIDFVLFVHRFFLFYVRKKHFLLLSFSFVPLLEHKKCTCQGVFENFFIFFKNFSLGDFPREFDFAVSRHTYIFTFLAKRFNSSLSCSNTPPPKTVANCGSSQTW